MKTITHLVLLLFVSVTYAVDLSFDDVNFRDKLLQSSTSNNIAKDSNGNSIKIDLDDSGTISDVEAALVYEINVSNSISAISSIVGVQGFVNLRVLNCDANSIANINLVGFTTLQEFSASSNNLTLVDLTGCINLSVLNLSNNTALSSIDFSTLTNLTSVDVNSCSLSTIDVANSFLLNTLNCSNNVLTTIFAKNGIDEVINLSGNTSLSYLCVDESQIATIQADVSSIPNCEVNSYCTLEPGGNYNTLSGRLVFDLLSNGIDNSDPKYAYLKMKTTIGSDVYQTVTKTDGTFRFYTQQTSGTYTQAPVLENTALITLPTASLTASLNGTNQNHDFNINPIILPLPDLEVVIAPVTPALPGTNAIYKIVYKNKGSRSVNARITLTFNNSLLTYVSSTQTATVSSGQLISTISSIKPYETRDFDVTFAVSPTATVGGQLNFVVTFYELLSITELLTNLADNNFNYNQTIENKPSVYVECLEGNNVSPIQIGQYLHYVIYFENTTNETINDITIKNIFDATKYDMNSLQILYAYHPLDFQAKNNKAEYRFKNAGVGGPGGHGGILLKIKTRNNLENGDSVINDADVYYDYNQPLNTVDEETVFGNLGVNDNNIDIAVKIYPNPTSSIINIDSVNEIKSIELYDANGRLIQYSTSSNNLNNGLDLSTKAKGIYFLKVTTEQGIKVEKIIRN